MYCKNCGREVKEYARFCPQCGQEIKGPVKLTEKTLECCEAKPVKEERVEHLAAGVTEEQVANKRVAENVEMAPVMSVFSYVILLLLSAIPILGTILIIVFAIDSSNKNKSNYCRAIIVFWLIGALIVVLFGASIFGFLYSL